MDNNQNGNQTNVNNTGYNTYGDQTNLNNAGYNTYGDQTNLNSAGYNTYGDQTILNDNQYNGQQVVNQVDTGVSNVYGNTNTTVDISGQYNYNQYGYDNGMNTQMDNNQYGYDNGMNAQYNPYAEYSDVNQNSSSFSYIPLIVVLLSLIAVGIAFLKYGVILGVITLIFSILQLKTKNKLYYIALALSVIAIIIGLITTFNLFGKTNKPENPPVDNTKNVALINDANAIIEAVKKDVAAKGVKYKVYTKQEIETLTSGSYKKSPYNNEYDKVSVSFIDNIDSADYSICLIDTAKNGFGYTSISDLKEDIVKVGTAPDNC